MTGRVSVLVPARDEEATLPECLTSLLDQVEVPDYEVVVVDDASGDRTAELVEAVAAADARVRLVRSAGPPPGWLGKTAACDLLARHATGEVLVFVDADVVWPRTRWPRRWTCCAARVWTSSARTRGSWR